MASSGFTREDYEADESAEVWPENWPAWLLFDELGGQWRTAGMRGVRYALDYSVLFARMDRMRLGDSDWLDLYHDVRVLEAAAVSQMTKA